MKKYFILSICLIIIFMLSACGAFDVNNPVTDEESKKPSKEIVTQGVDETNDADADFEVETEPDTEVVVQKKAKSLEEAQQNIKMFSNAEYEAVEYDVEYGFTNKSYPTYDFSGKVTVEGIDINLPSTYTDLAESGITYYDLDTFIDATDISCELNLTAIENTTEAEKRLMMYFINPYEIEQPLDSFICYGLQIYPSDGYSFNIDGINESMTNIKDVIGFLGEPDSIVYYKLEDGISFDYGTLGIITDINGNIEYISFRK